MSLSISPVTEAGTGDSTARDGGNALAPTELGREAASEEDGGNDELPSRDGRLRGWKERQVLISSSFTTGRCT